MRIVDYTESLAPLRGCSISYRNPKYWNGEVEPVDRYISNNPKIVAAYEKAGIPAWEGKLEIAVTPKTEVKPVNLVIPDDWMSLSWPRKRAMATNVIGAKVESKLRAEEILDAAYKKQLGV